MYYPEELITEIRDKNDIVDVVGSYVSLKKKGRSYFGLCPFHNEKSPSFSVDPYKQMYYCFGCGEGGNVFKFVEKYEHYDFLEAVEMLAERAGVELPKNNDPRQMKEAGIRKNILEVYKETAKYYYFLLRSEHGKEAYKYLKDRELSDETIKQFGLGYSDRLSNDLYNYLKSKDYTDDLLKQTGLFSYKGDKVYDKFFNRVMFPIMDINNKVIAFGGRIMGETTPNSPKYLNSPETIVFDKSRNMYGLNIARTSRKNFFLICEGYMDVIALHQAGFNNAVASLGTAFTSGHASLIKRYVNEVVLTFDSDGAGVAAALRAIPILRKAGIQIKVLDMKPYKDPDEFIKNLSAEEYQKRIDNASNFFMFRVAVASRDFNLSDPQEKTAFYNRVAEMLLDFDEELERLNYLEWVSLEYNIPKEALSNLVKNKAIDYVKKPVEDREETEIKKRMVRDDGVTKAQKLLITWMTEEPSIFERIKEYLSPEDFVDEFYHQIATYIWEQFENGKLSPVEIIGKYTDDEMQSKVAALFNTPISEELSLDEKQKTINDIVRRIKKNSLDYQARNIEDISQMQDIIIKQTELGNINIRL